MRQASQRDERRIIQGLQPRFVTNHSLGRRRNGVMRNQRWHSFARGREVVWPGLAGILGERRQEFHRMNEMGQLKGLTHQSPHHGQQQQIFWSAQQVLASLVTGITDGWPPHGALAPAGPVPTSWPELRARNRFVCWRDRRGAYPSFRKRCRRR